MIDLSLDIQQASQEFTDYLQQNILLPCQNYFQAALKVRPLAGNLTTGSYTSFEGYDIPSIYVSPGVPADLVIFVLSGPSTESYIASASAVILDGATNR